ncbi:ABC transporter permease [Micrococcus luteus]|nr:ABC transporter permease [Micrococcus luteus]
MTALASRPGAASRASRSAPVSPASRSTRRTHRRRTLVGAGTVLRRLAGAVGVVWATATLTFLMQFLLPGDRATLVFNLRAGQAQPRTAEELAPLNALFGFQDPVLVQYLHFLGGLLRGDLGTSYVTFEPVTTVIGDQLAPTLLLTGASIAIAWAVALVLLVATVRRARWVSGLASAVEALLAALPHYWLGVILLVVFALGLGLFPVVGGTGPAALVLPALTMGLPLAGYLAQTMRSEYASVLDQPFILTARTRGQSDAGIRVRHALRHALLPGLSLTGWAVGAQFSAAVIAEGVFSRPGIGGVLVDAANGRDLPVVCGVVVLIAIVYVLANLAVDVLYTVVDPRLRSAR